MAKNFGSIGWHNAKVSLNLLIDFALTSQFLSSLFVSWVNLRECPYTDDLELSDSKIKAMVARWAEVVEINEQTVQEQQSPDTRRSRIGFRRRTARHRVPA